MWGVSQRFLETISVAHALRTTITATPYGGAPTVLRSAAATIVADRSQRIRRSGNCIVEGGSSVYAMLSQPGTRIAVDHGFSWSGLEQELVPMIRSELTSASLRLGDGVIGIALADYWQRLIAAEYIDAYSPPTTSTRVQEIITAVTSAMPGITVDSSRATDRGTVGTAQAWTSRADLVTAYATDGGMEAFFGPDGTFVLRDAPKITDTVAWLIKTGTGGTLDTLTRNRPLDRLVNTVIVTPGTADPAQTWTQVVAQIADTNDPRHPNRIGVRVFRYSAPTLLTADDAARVGQQLLTRFQGATETLALDALSNPALEPGDILRASTPLDGGGDIVNHYLEQVSWDLTTGSMTANTRSNDEVTA